MTPGRVVPLRRPNGSSPKVAHIAQPGTLAHVREHGGAVLALCGYSEMHERGGPERPPDDRPVCQMCVRALIAAQTVEGRFV